MVNQILILISQMLIFSMSLMLVAFGGMFSERSGVINIGLEGVMVVGGMAGLLVLRLVGGDGLGLNPFLVVLLTILTSIIVGMLYSGLLAVACIKFKADQTLVGTALNLLATSISIIVVKKVTNGASTDLKYDTSAFVYNFGYFNFNIFLFLGLFILIASIIVLYKLKFGLRLRACGENPSAADSVGINVNAYRYVGVLISGALGGLGALAYIIPTSSYWNSTDGVAGFGFLALAVMIFGQWKPLRIFIISIVFSLFMSLSFIYYDFFKELFNISLNAQHGVTPELFRMLPYIASLILLAFTSKNSRAPKAEGIPYDKTRR